MTQCEKYRAQYKELRDIQFQVVGLLNHFDTEKREIQKKDISNHYDGILLVRSGLDTLQGLERVRSTDDDARCYLSVCYVQGAGFSVRKSIPRFARSASVAAGLSFVR